MRSGKLRRLITFQKATGLSDDFSTDDWGSSDAFYVEMQSSLTGEYLTSWATVSSNVWSNVKQVQGGEIFEAGMPQERSKVVIEIHTRYSSVVNRKMRAVYRGNNYLIKNVNNIKGRNKEMIITAEAVS